MWSVRPFRVYVLAILTLTLGAATGFCKPTNVVLILSDDQAWNDYGFMGHPHIQTPHLDQLASESVVFRRGYVPTSLCRPSLMTLITGHYAHRHGVTGNDPSPKYARPGTPAYAQRRSALIDKIDQFTTLPESLAARGYLSHQSGKWWEGPFRRGGFTHGMTQGFPNPGGRHGDAGLKIGRESMQPIEEFLDHAALAEDKPFFLWYAPFLPHTPHNPPQRLLDRYADVESKTQAKYFAMCTWFDETCGQLLKILEDRQLRENTLVVYVTDNGWIQHPERNGYDARSKQTPYEGGVRTPILFRLPNTLKPADRPELVSSIDIYPTIASLCDAETPPDLPGIDLSDTLRHGTPIHRDTIYGEGFSHDIADLQAPERTLLYRWCIEGPWKLILTYDGEVNRYQSTHPRAIRGPQLFHVIDDPHEEQNRAAENPDVVDRLRSKIDNWYPLKTAHLR